MTGWVHVRVWGSGECDGQSTDDPRVPCGCTTPDPDPTSPCESCGHDADIHAGCGCCVGPGGCEGECFIYRPTLCRCGHRIEEAP